MVVEKRRFPRVVFKCLVYVRYENKTEIYPSYTGNISLGGLMVTLQYKLQTDTQVLIELFLKEKERPLQVSGQVRWVTSTSAVENDDTMYDTGIEFSILTEDARMRLNAVVSQVSSQ